MYVPYIALELCLNAKCQMIFLILPQPSSGKIPTPNRNKSEYSVQMYNVQCKPTEEEKKTREEEALIEMKPIFSVPT